MLNVLWWTTLTNSEYPHKIFGTLKKQHLSSFSVYFNGFPCMSHMFPNVVAPLLPITPPPPPQNFIAMGMAECDVPGSHQPLLLISQELQSHVQRNGHSSLHDLPALMDVFRTCFASSQDGKLAEVYFLWREWRKGLRSLCRLHNHLKDMPDRVLRAAGDALLELCDPGPCPDWYRFWEPFNPLFDCKQVRGRLYAFLNAHHVPEEDPNSSLAALADHLWWRTRGPKSRSGRNPATWAGDDDASYGRKSKAQARYKVRGAQTQRPRARAGAYVGRARTAGSVPHAAEGAAPAVLSALSAEPVLTCQPPPGSSIENGKVIVPAE